MTCKYFDCGWCYAPNNVKTNAVQGGCFEPQFCPYLKSQMTINLHDYVDKEVIITYRNGIDVVSKVYHTNNASFCQYHYGISDRWYTKDGRVLIDQESPLDIVSIVTVEENDKNFEHSKQIIDKTMTEKEEIQSKIASLQKQLAAIEEEEKSKSPAEEAYKLWWGEYPTNTWQGDVNRWEAFQTGYNAAKTENVNEIEEPLPAKDKVTLYTRFYRNGTYGCLGFDEALKVVREFLIDEGKIEGENEVNITVTLEKSLLEMPNDNLPYFVGN